MSGDRSQKRIYVWYSWRIWKAGVARFRMSNDKYIIDLMGNDKALEKRKRKEGREAD